MKITIVGTCQVHGMAEGLRKTVHGVSVHPYHVSAKSDFGALYNEIKSSDLVVSQMLPQHNLAEVVPDLLAGLAQRFTIVPPIVFRGFHPDSTIIIHEGEQVDSPIRNYHSTILIASYLLGLSWERGARLINSYVFQRLGYFDAFAEAKALLTQSMAPYDLDGFVERNWSAWTMDGCFMHTPNHPHVRVLSAFGVEAVQRAVPTNLAPSPTGPLHDILATQNAWYVPEHLARRLGVTPIDRFRAYLKPGESEEFRYFTLDSFASASFDIFKRTPVEALRAAAGVEAAVNGIDSLLARQ